MSIVVLYTLYCFGCLRRRLSRIVFLGGSIVVLLLLILLERIQL